MARNRTIPALTDHDRDLVRGLVLHEDAAVLAFNKPSGLPSQVRGNRARNLDHLLWAFAKSNGKRPRLVHRLDSGTSGVVVAAKTQPDAVAISRQFEARAVEKTYLALVVGAPDADTGIIDAPIARVEVAGRSRIIAGHRDGKPAETLWRVLSRSDDHALVEAKPKTGRMHQIRVHLAHLGCPIAGDALYGGGAASRMALHALSLAFDHPRTGKRMTVSALVPGDLKSLGLASGLSSAVFETTSLF
ncbi:MAG: RluA family pseudouridine synthase [Pseudomonadota bacterium]